MARIFRCHFIGLLFKFYRTLCSTYPQPPPLGREHGIHFPRAGLSAKGRHWSDTILDHEKEPAPRSRMKSLLFQDSSLLSSLKRLGHTVLSSFIHHFIPVSYRNSIKRESQNVNQPHLQVLLHVCCLFDSDGERMAENQGLWEDCPHSSLFCCGLLSNWCNRRSGACVCFSWHSQRWCL